MSELPWFGRIDVIAGCALWAVGCLTGLSALLYRSVDRALRAAKTSRDWRKFNAFFKYTDKQEAERDAK